MNEEKAHTFLIRQAKYHFSPFGPGDDALLTLQIPAPQGHRGVLTVIPLNVSHQSKKPHLPWKKNSEDFKEINNCIKYQVPIESKELS